MLLLKLDLKIENLHSEKRRLAGIRERISGSVSSIDIHS